MDARQTRRRYYACCHCQKYGRAHVAERYRMVAHVYKHHLALDQAPYYCSLCMFRCTTREALEKHVTGYTKHATEASTVGGDPRRFLGRNSNPSLVQEGKDYRTATPEDLAQRGFSTHDDLLGKLEGWTDDPANEELINVRVTPQLLDELMNKPTVVKAQEYDPSNPGFKSAAPGLSQKAEPYMHAPTGKSQLSPSTYDFIATTFHGKNMYTNKAIPSNTSIQAASVGLMTNASSYSYGRDPMLYGSSERGNAYLTIEVVATAPDGKNTIKSSVTTTAHSMLPTTTLDMHSHRNPVTIISSGLDASPSLTFPHHSPSQDKLNQPRHDRNCVSMPSALSTPIVSAVSPRDQVTKSPSIVEDINEQFLGKEEPFAFSPVQRQYLEKECQTNMVDGNDNCLTSATAATVVHLEKVLEAGFSKFVDAIHRVCSTIHEVDRSLSKMADSMTRMERSVDSLALHSRSRENQRSEVTTKRPRLEEKEKLPVKSKK